ncbi:winged helix-turn-helix domain-containing protein [Phreatobacter oligotrophus]|uniref:winged helix-turn-helix domain-containing protein n=1 Tax=Phreatobacter oligotrophus TaxID=1122261 RepID=UPI00235292E0|nr:crosslink repair DNA glycosylase YcaQ family protein [Phreatobacter oligotrophus]MBX9991110.1 winged helix DNA-binding domain-containing protein [Phreatobacter oligotrophus]
MSRRSDSLSLRQARRIAISAQGFDLAGHGEGRGASPSERRHLKRMAEELGVIQIDSVNVVARAHTLPGFSRLGLYDPADLDALAYGGRRRALFEYWGHEASYLPVALQPLFRWRMERARRGEGIYTGLATFGRERQDLIEEVRREIETDGPKAAGELSHDHRGEGGWWGWSEGKRAIEWLFWAGIVTTATRRGAFERIYDLTGRVLPRAVIETPTPDEATAHRELVRRSAIALGIGTERCLRDYYRLGVAETRQAVAELVEAGDLVPVTVEGFRNPAYLAAGARIPRRVEARALLAPFDPLVWQRERTEGLFGARIRLEIYTPAEKRTHGYYVLPFLLGDRLVARVDLKADRAGSALVVQAAHREEGAGDAVAGPLAEELRLMARWLGLADVRVMPRGDLAAALAGEVG